MEFVYLLYETHEYEDFLIDVFLSEDGANKKIKELKEIREIPFYYRHRVDKHEVKE